MKRVLALALGALTIGSIVLAAEAPLKVDESRHELTVRAVAPYAPDRNNNPAQMKALARESAIVRGQSALLSYILEKKARSQKTLAEAKASSEELDQRIHGYIFGARLTKTQWLKDSCVVTLVLKKDLLQDILDKN